MECLLIFDFDGVILESVGVKTEAFRALFSFSKEHVDEIVRFHVENGGMSRFDKFRHIYANILHEDLSREKFDALSAQFAQLVEEKVIRAPFVAGAPEALVALQAQFPLYIVSATPQDELIRIVHARGIAQYFRGILGSPQQKAEHIRDILRTTGLSANHVIFVGDAINDWKAAQACGVRFVARVKPGEPDAFSGCTGIGHRVADMQELREYLDGMPC